MATSSSSGAPTADDSIIASSLNTISMAHAVETVDLNPEGSVPRPEEAEVEQRGDAQEDCEAEQSSRGTHETGTVPVEEACTSGDDSTEVIARGIASVLRPVVRTFETKVEEVLKSQSTLESSINRLTRELDKLLEDTPLPLGLHHAAKLTGIRKRVGSLMETLRTIQGRINYMDHMLSSGNVGSLH